MEMSSDLHKTDKADLSAIEEARQLQAQTKPGFFESFKVFRDPQFLALTMAELTASVGYLIPLYYMQSKQTPHFQCFMICYNNDIVRRGCRGISHKLTTNPLMVSIHFFTAYAVFIGLTPQRGAMILGLSNGASFTGRIALGILSDYISNAKVLLVCAWMTAFCVTILWTFSTTFVAFLSMALIFGFFAGKGLICLVIKHLLPPQNWSISKQFAPTFFFLGGYVSLVPVAVAESFGKNGSRL